jgi:hypothetical protein
MNSLHWEKSAVSCSYVLRGNSEAANSWMAYSEMLKKSYSRTFHIIWQGKSFRSFLLFQFTASWTIPLHTALLILPFGNPRNFYWTFQEKVLVKRQSEVLEVSQFTRTALPSHKQSASLGAFSGCTNVRRAFSSVGFMLAQRHCGFCVLPRPLMWAKHTWIHRLHYTSLSLTFQLKLDMKNEHKIVLFNWHFWRPIFLEKE